MVRRVVLISAFMASVLCMIMEAAPSGTKAFAAEQQAVATQQPATVQQEGAYEYGGLNRRDPFAPLISKREAGREKGLGPLEAYDVNEMKLIAILWSKNKYYAVFSLPDGKSYSVNEGAKVGTRNGVVAKIVKDHVVIRERVRDARGVMVPRDTVLRLRGEEEE